MAAEIQFNVDQALAKLGELVAKHGPQAVDLAAQVVQVNALGDLVGAAIGTTIATGLAFATFKITKAWWARQSDYNARHEAWMTDHTGNVRYPTGEPFGYCMISLGSVLATAFVAIPSILSLADVWMWVAFFNPKLALAHQVLAKLTGG